MDIIDCFSDSGVVASPATCCGVYLAPEAAPNKYRTYLLQPIDGSVRSMPVDGRRSCGYQFASGRRWWVIERLNFWLNRIRLYCPRGRRARRPLRAEARLCITYS